MQTHRNPEDLSRVLAALSDPIRRQMVSRLARGPATVGQLSSPFSVSKPAISRHVRVLEQAGLLKREKRGREHWCHLETAALSGVGDFVTETLTFWTSQLDQLAAYLEDEDDD